MRAREASKKRAASAFRAPMGNATAAGLRGPTHHGGSAPFEHTRSNTGLRAKNLAWGHAQGGLDGWHEAPPAWGAGRSVGGWSAGRSLRVRRRDPRALRCAPALLARPSLHTLRPTTATLGLAELRAAPVPACA